MERENANGKQQGTYFMVWDFMVSELKLKGAERDVYAIINGFCQDKESCFRGSLKYLSRLTGYTDRRILEALNQLTAKGYIAKRIEKVKGIRRCFYSIPKNFQYRNNFSTEIISPEPPKLFHQPTEIISPPLHYNKEILKKDNKSLVNSPANLPDSETVNSETQTRNYEAQPFTIEEFSEMWNKWIDKNNLDVDHVRLKASKKRRNKFKLRQKNFADEGANTRDFWQQILFCVRLAKSGFYVTATDEKDWTITLDWLLKSDEIIVKFMEAEVKKEVLARETPEI